MRLVTRLSSAGALRDLQLKAPRSFKVTPYVTRASRRDFSVPAPTSDKGDRGIDAKSGVTPSLNLDLHNTSGVAAGDDRNRTSHQFDIFD